MSRVAGPLRAASRLALHRFRGGAAAGLPRALAGGGEGEGSANLEATSLAEAVRRSKEVQVLDLSGSEDLMCMNLLCEKVGEPCICRLSRVLERLPDLRELRLANNKLDRLPDSVWDLSKLERLDLSGNELRELPAAAGQLGCLRELRLGGNPVGSVPGEVAALGLDVLELGGGDGTQLGGKGGKHAGCTCEADE